MHYSIEDYNKTNYLKYDSSLLRFYAKQVNQGPPFKVQLLHVHSWIIHALVENVQLIRWKRSANPCSSWANVQLIYVAARFKVD